MSLEEGENGVHSRLIGVLLAIAVGVVVPATVSAGPSHAASWVDGRQFGLHIPQIANGEAPDVNYGMVRLWDSGVSWGLVERRSGVFTWSGLDRAVRAAKAQGAEVLYVLGSTPTWAASSRKQGSYPNRGAASMPESLRDWRRWVTAVATRYRGSIDAYQVWNEANLQTFWQGTPKQMARLTKEAYRIINRIDPGATVVAASSTVRLANAFTRFFPSYLKELRKLRWPVDAFSFHSYGPSTATPAIREKYAERVRKELRTAKAPARPLWDTEVNYGIKGPGQGYPDRDIGGAKAARFVAQTYLDSVRLGIVRTFWYSWNQRNDLLGVTMDSGYPGATAFEVTRNWLSDARVGCRSRHVRVCRVDRSGEQSRVAWTSSGKTGTLIAPYYATRMCNALGRCAAVVPGQRIPVGRMPVWVGCPSGSAANCVAGERERVRKRHEAMRRLTLPM